MTLPLNRSVRVDESDKLTQHNLLEEAVNQTAIILLLMDCDAVLKVRALKMCVSRNELHTWIHVYTH